MANKGRKKPQDTQDPRVRERYGTIGSVAGIIVNCLLAASKLVIGLTSRSMAVTSDGINNLSDASGSLMSLVSVRMATKAADREHPFGHGRMEYVGSLVIGGIIILAGWQLLQESVRAILHPAPLSFSSPLVVVLGFSILGKLWLSRFTLSLGRTVQSEPLLAESKDSLSDMLGTIAILVSLVLQAAYGWHIDGWMSLVVSVMVLGTGMGVCKETVTKLLGSEPDPLMVDELKDKLLSYPGIYGIHDLVIHDYGPGRWIITVHAEVKADSNIVAIHEVIDRAEREIGEAMHASITIHMDPVVTDDPLVCTLKCRMEDCLRAIDGSLTLHDFRLVPGDHRTNLIFDVLVPTDLHVDPAMIQDRLAAYARSIDPTYRVVVNFDTAFD